MGAGTWTPEAVVLEVSGAYEYNCQPVGGVFGGIAMGDNPVYLYCEFV